MLSLRLAAEPDITRSVMYTPVSVMRTPSVLEENDSRDQLWAVSEIFLRAGRNRSSVRHNSFLWSLAPLRLVLNVKGKIPYKSAQGVTCRTDTHGCPPSRSAGERGAAAILTLLPRSAAAPRGRAGRLACGDGRRGSLSRTRHE